MGLLNGRGESVEFPEPPKGMFWRVMKGQSIEMFYAVSDFVKLIEDVDHPAIRFKLSDPTTWFSCHTGYTTEHVRGVCEVDDLNPETLLDAANGILAGRLADQRKLEAYGDYPPKKLSELAQGK